ncbi:inovirus Gp2 family protein [Vreelandella neptunia]|uniref:inovirus Gp2 family protein n=1 Tax=Vreelandella neptunia TaxID=115551 RepID=UPI00315B18F4
MTSLHYDPLFNDMPIQEEFLPMVTVYLDALQKALENALDDYPRVVAIRFDLNLPITLSNQMTVENHKKLIPRFTASLKAIIKHDIKRRRKSNWVPDTKVRIVWAREVGDDGKLHYHFFLILNRGTYIVAGKAGSPDENLVSRISRALYSALDIQWDPQTPLIHVPKKPTYWIDRDDPESFRRAFYRASYLCKADTKQYGQGMRAFGASHS